MRKVFKCFAKETGYHFTQGKNYEVDLNVLVRAQVGPQQNPQKLLPPPGKKYHNIINDKGIQHYIWDDDLEKFFIDLEQVRQDKLEELLK